MTWKVIVGDDPQVRGNIARSYLQMGMIVRYNNGLYQVIAAKNNEKKVWLNKFSRKKKKPLS